MDEENKGLQLFTNPPKKVEQMFRAVIELMDQQMDIHALKVSDITAKAGIGKGTAYEYFSSKEEIITLALLYDYKLRLDTLAKDLLNCENFHDKIFCILDWVEENCQYHMNFIRLMQKNTKDANICHTIMEQVSDEVFDQIHGYLFDEGNKLLEEGYAENYFTQKDPVKRRLAFASAIIEYAVTLDKKKDERLFCIEHEFFHMDSKAAKEFSYESMIKALS